MRKLLPIAWKDLRLTWRDPGALLLLLVTPFLLTLAMGSALSSPLESIPVVLVDQDGGEMSAVIGQALRSPEVSDLIQLTELEHVAQAQAVVEQDQAAAAVVIPAGFTAAIIPAQEGAPPSGNAAKLTILTSPARPIGAGVTRAILDQVVAQINGGALGGRVTMEGLLESGRLSAEEAQSSTLGRSAGEASANPAQVNLQVTTAAGEATNLLDAMAPSMAILFLMFTVTSGGRSILAERDAGTLARLLTTPSSRFQVLGGKVLGIYLTGLSQLVVLALAGRWILGRSWGPALEVSALILALVFAATGWGALLAAVARTPAQANISGTALTLIFAVGSGNFFDRAALPAWLQTASRISPNAWGLEAFAALQRGASWGGLMQPLLAMLLMGALLFGLALLVFRTQNR